jgi:hypothetical protein
VKTHICPRKLPPQKPPKECRLEKLKLLHEKELSRILIPELQIRNPENPLDWSVGAESWGWMVARLNGEGEPEGDRSAKPHCEEIFIES